LKTTGVCSLEAEFYMGGLFEGKFTFKMIKAMYEGMKKMITMPDSTSTKMFQRINHHYD